MTQLKTILVCILPDLKTGILSQYVLNSISFANQVGADVHFLMPMESQADVDSALKRITAQGPQAIKTVSHTAMGASPIRAVSEAVKRFSCDLVLIPSGGITREDGYGAELRRDLLEQSCAPILILSPKVDFSKSPLTSVLIPMSGEIRLSSALAFGLHLASRIHVPVDLVHVVRGENSPLETSGDQPHHEYRQLLDKVLAEACPFSDAKERAQVRSLYNVQGAPSVEILKAAQNDLSRALIVEWHGSLIHGKAETLKQILQQIGVPVFLIRTVVEQKSVLKIGPEDQVA